MSAPVSTLPVAAAPAASAPASRPEAGRFGEILGRAVGSPDRGDEGRAAPDAGRTSAVGDADQGAATVPTSTLDRLARRAEHAKGPAEDRGSDTPDVGPSDRASDVALAAASTGVAQALAHAGGPTVTAESPPPTPEVIAGTTPLPTTVVVASPATTTTTDLGGDTPSEAPDAGVPVQPLAAASPPPGHVAGNGGPAATEAAQRVAAEVAVPAVAEAPGTTARRPATVRSADGAPILAPSSAAASMVADEVGADGQVGAGRTDVPAPAALAAAAPITRPTVGALAAAAPGATPATPATFGTPARAVAATPAAAGATPAPTAATTTAIPGVETPAGQGPADLATALAAGIPSEPVASAGTTTAGTDPLAVATADLERAVRELLDAVAPAELAAGPASEQVGPAASDVARATVDAVGNGAASAAARAGVATTPAPSTVPPAAFGNAVVQRMLDIARVLENAPPPRSVMIELGELRGLRLEIRVGEAGAIHVTAHGRADAVQPLASLGRDLADALSQRGMHLGDFQTRQDGREPEAGPGADAGADRDPSTSGRGTRGDASQQARAAPSTRRPDDHALRL